MHDLCKCNILIAALKIDTSKICVIGGINRKLYCILTPASNVPHLDHRLGLES